MKIIDIERTVRRGAASLAESVHFYWPAATPQNEIPERNITLHLGHAFSNAGFLTYCDAHNDGSTKTFLDLLAVHPYEKVLVACEFKRLSWDARQSQGMVDDAQRVLRFKMQKSPELRHVGLEVGRGFGLLAAITWLQPLARWFTTFEQSPPDPTGGKFDQLRAALPSETIWNAYALSDHYDQSGERKTHWLVYALFPLPALS